MDLNTLQIQAYQNSKRWFPTLHDQPELLVLMYMGLGLAGEAGEAVDNIKKLARNAIRTGYPSDDAEQQAMIADLRTELGDVLAYLMIVAELVGADLGEEFTAKAEFNETRKWVGGNG